MGEAGHPLQASTPSPASRAGTQTRHPLGAPGALTWVDWVAAPGTIGGRSRRSRRQQHQEPQQEPESRAGGGHGGERAETAHRPAGRWAVRVNPNSGEGL